MRPFRQPGNRPSTQQRGVTLIEILVVVAIIGILAMMAAPSFNDFIKNQRVKAMASDMHMSLLRARSEAIKRNRDVTIAPMTAGSWPDGWTIPDPDNAGSNIEYHSSIAGLTVAGPANVVYQNSGRIRGATAPSFDISATGSNAKRCVSADLSGRPYTKATAC